MFNTKIRKKLLMVGIFITIILFSMICVYGVSFTVDYKNDYLEPSKTYDLWVIVEPDFNSDEPLNNTVIMIKPYDYLSKKYIKIIKGTDYEGQIFPNDKGVGHFIISISPDAPSRDYKMEAICTYKKDGDTYSNNVIFTLPIRGVPSLTVKNNPTLNEGVSKAYITISNGGTGPAYNVKLSFDNSKSYNIYALTEGHIDCIKPNEAKVIVIDTVVKGNGNSVVKLPYTLTYESPYDLLQLTEKTKTINENSESESYNYENRKIMTESGILVFNVEPKEDVSISLKEYSIILKKINNITLTVKNNDKTGKYITVKLLSNYVGNNEKTLYLLGNSSQNITFKVRSDKEGIVYLPLELSYNGINIYKNISLNVIGVPKIIITGVDIKGGGEKTITGDISNIGSANAYGVVVSVERKNNIIPIMPFESYFVGTLNKDDYSSFEVHCKLLGNVSQIPLIITYRDENNNIINEKYNISIYQNNNNIIGNNKISNNNKNNILFYVVIGIGVLFGIGLLILAIYVIYKYIKKKSEDEEYIELNLDDEDDDEYDNDLNK